MNVRPECAYKDYSTNLNSEFRLERRSGEVENGGEKEDGEVERREIMMEKKLPIHQEKRKVMQDPTNKKETGQSVIILDSSCDKPIRQSLKNSYQGRGCSLLLFRSLYPRLARMMMRPLAIAYSRTEKELSHHMTGLPIK